MYSVIVGVVGVVRVVCVVRVVRVVGGVVDKLTCKLNILRQ